MRERGRGREERSGTRDAAAVYELAAYPAFAAIKFEFTTRNGLESKTRKKRGKKEEKKKGE